MDLIVEFPDQRSTDRWDVVVSSEQVCDTAFHASAFRLPSSSPYRGKLGAAAACAWIAVKLRAPAHRAPCGIEEKA